MKRKIIFLILLLFIIISFNGNNFLAGSRRVNSDLNDVSLKAETVFREISKKEQQQEQSRLLTMQTKSKPKYNLQTIDFRGMEFKENREDDSFSQVPLIEKIHDHRVKKGENLWDIAHQYNIDIDTIIGANDISNMNRIKSGQVLKILPVKGLLYKIGPGENLWNIANKFEINVKKVIKANDIENPELIKPGKFIILPGAKPEFGYRDRLEKKLIAPVQARISSYYGGRWGRMHEGIDYAVSIGTNIRAAGAGKIIYSGWASGYGKTVIIRHRKGLRTLYAHNSELLVHSGEWVSRGSVISHSGNTGRSTGPHLHFEIQINGKPVNPLNYLRD